eukprot:7297479-Prymnesium_polylepis.1
MCCGALAVARRTSAERTGVRAPEGGCIQPVARIRPYRAPYATDVPPTRAAHGASCCAVAQPHAAATSTEPSVQRSEKGIGVCGVARPSAPPAVAAAASTGRESAADSMVTVR